MKGNHITIIIIVAVFGFIIYSRFKGEKEYIKSPIDSLITAYSLERNFSIILNDMDYNEDEDRYRHKYQIVIAKEVEDTTIVNEFTDWKVVSDELFDENIDNLGMELVSKKDGVLKKAVAPAGYSNFIGNERYGHWQHRNGGSFWEFYGKYSMLRNVFYMFSSPVRYSYWSNYNTSYYPYGKSYYGGYTNSNKKLYGTNSVFASTNYKNTNWSKKTTSFKNRVRSKVKQSATRSRKSRISRTSSRYNNSSTRSRSGGFGK